ncbi:MAG: hypothetical protein ACK5NL_07990, partial [Vibrio fluvialis]
FLKFKTRPFRHLTAQVNCAYAFTAGACSRSHQSNFKMKLLKYAALKIPALPFQDAKCVFCKFTQHQPSPSLRSGEYKEGNATTISLWRIVGGKAKKLRGTQGKVVCKKNCGD